MSYGGASIGPFVWAGMLPPGVGFQGNDLDGEFGDQNDYAVGAPGVPMPYGAMGNGPGMAPHGTYAAQRARNRAGLRPAAMNLLDEFDRGIQRVRGWKFGDGEQA